MDNAYSVDTINYLQNNEFSDALVRLECNIFRLLISRFQVRVLGDSLGKVLVLQVKRKDDRSPLVVYRGFSL